MKRFLPIVVVLALAAVTANAAISTEFVLVGEGTVTGYNTYDMVAHCTTDWTNARLDLVLTAGSLYQHFAGSNVEPSPLFFPGFPELEFDTYLTVPAGNPDVPGFGGVTQCDTAGIGASWFDSVDDGPGSHVVARITLSQDAQGLLTAPAGVTGTNYDVDTTGVGVDYEFDIIDGHIVPEPATLALLAFGGLAVLIRKRR